MKKIWKKLILLAVFLGAGFQVSGLSAHAEQVITSLTVSPQHQSIILVPGETYQGSIKVSSQVTSTRPSEFEVSVGPFSDAKAEGSRDDYGAVNYVDRSNYNMIVDWIEVGEPKETVDPNDTVTVPFTIKVPQDVPAGGQYASLIVKDATPPSQQGQGVAVNSVMQILSIIYAEVVGDTREEGVVSTNTMPSFLLNGPLVMESMVRNNGNIHTMAEYKMQVWPLFSNEEICTNVEDPDTSLVMPETERYHAQTCELPAVGIFKAKQEVKIFNEVSTVERMIIICPLWLLFLIIFVVVAIIIWLVMQFRRRKAQPKKEES